MSRDFRREVRTQLADVQKKLDFGLLLKISLDSGIIRTNPFQNEEIDSDSLFFLAKAIFKNKFPSSSIRKNRSGMSISVSSNEIIENLAMIPTIESHSNNLDRNSLAMKLLYFFVSNLNYGSSMNVTLGDNRLLFQINYGTNVYDYNPYLLYTRILGCINAIKKYESYNSKLDEIRNEIAELERINRENIERTRLAEEERTRLAEEERIRREEEQRRLDNLNQERTEMLRRGATSNGIDIGRRLAEILAQNNNN